MYRRQSNPTSPRGRPNSTMPTSPPGRPAYLLQGGDRIFDVSQQISEGDRVESLLGKGQVIGDCSDSVSSRVLDDHLMAEVDRHYQMALGFE